MKEHTRADLKSRLDDTREKAQGFDEREQVQTWWFGVGLAGFVIPVGGDLGSSEMGSSPPILSDLLLTCILGATLMLAHSRACLRLGRQKLRKVERGIEKTLQGELSDRGVPESELVVHFEMRIVRSDLWIYVGYVFLVTTFPLGMLAMSLFLTGVWWSQ